MLVSILDRYGIVECQCMCTFYHLVQMYMADIIWCTVWIGKSFSITNQWFRTFSLCAVDTVLPSDGCKGQWNTIYNLQWISLLSGVCTLSLQCLDQFHVTWLQLANTHILGYIYCWFIILHPLLIPIGNSYHFMWNIKVLQLTLLLWPSICSIVVGPSKLLIQYSCTIACSTIHTCILYNVYLLYKHDMHYNL